MLSEKVTRLKGIGEKTAQDLALMGIDSIEDLLFYLPYRYEIRELKPLRELEHEANVTVLGEIITAPQVVYGKKRRTIFNIRVEDAVVRVVMFFALYQSDSLRKGSRLTVTGKWDAYRLQITASSFKLGEPSATVEIDSVYSVKGNVKMGRLRSFIKQAIEDYSHQIEEILPQSYLQAYKLPCRRDTIRSLHFPENTQALTHARRRYIYEEFLLYQLKMQVYKERRKAERKGSQIPIDRKKVNEFIEHLPFRLTRSQQRSLEEIFSDLASDRQMYRLLQGDVGSGKTAVAMISLYSVAIAGFQGALMVPTEILAEQHYESIKKMFEPEHVVALLTSSIKGKKRKEVLKGLEAGEIDLLIGTHSLIQDEVHFNKLGLVIIDEQHRFGVAQRKRLLEKGDQPDVLHMTATPIPRTLAITAFGDLDISTIDELPKGRKPVQTYVIQEHLLQRLLRFIEDKVKDGEQVYFISPLIEESEAFDYENAIDLYEKLRQYYPEEIRIGLLHGKMANDEKEDMMKRFVQNDIQILVSTTVIEVGVNVPNATVMVIYDAERFGLSQLHQLRGRVGRGDKQSYCILIADPKGEVGKERMKIISETTNGFHLAEADLKLRGPGDFFGKRQSGLPDFKVADPIENFRALEVARKDAIELVQTRKLFSDPSYEALHRVIEGELQAPFD